MIVFVTPLDSTNNIFSMTVDVGAPEVTCQFLNGPVDSATYTFQYGTDPTYINLPHTDSSNGTNSGTIRTVYEKRLLFDN